MLRERGLQAILFANAAPIAGPFVPLDNVLSIARSRLPVDRYREALLDAGLDTKAIAKASRGSAYGMRPGVMLDVKAHMLNALGIAETALHHDLGLFLAPAELRALADFGIEVANHTMSHTCCHLLDTAEIGHEIVAARTALEDMTGRPVRAFAFPWGHERDCTTEVLAAIRASGHRATFLMHGRTNDRRPEPDVWYRSLVESQTGLALAADLRLKPILRSLKHRASHALRR